MPRVFHWNLQNYYGRNIERNANLAAALEQIPEEDRADVVVAGFTEMRANHCVASAGLSEIAQKLLPPDAARIKIIDVGITINGYQEYAGIVWHPEVDMHFAGVVLPGNDTTSHSVSIEDRAGRIITRDAFDVADVRGIAFIACVFDEVNYLFGFMHNVYRDADRRVFSNMLLPSMVNRVKAALESQPCNFPVQRVIIGGDFNVEPHVRQHGYNTRQPLVAYPPVAYGADQWLGGEVPMEGVDLPAIEIAYARTTAVHTFDYFYVSGPELPPIAARAYLATRQEAPTDRTRPDHAAISLQFLPPRA